jgi:regulatory protein
MHKINQNKSKIPKRITQRYLQNAGQFYLERFTASRAHFEKIMRLKITRSCQHHTDQNIDECIEWLQKITDDFVRLGFLNDDLYSRGLAISLRRRGLSAKLIQQKMRLKGVPSDMITIALNDADSDIMNDHENENENPDLNAALIFARKKKIGAYAPYSYEDEPDRFRKDMAKLARAGFGFEIVQKVMKA